MEKKIWKRLASVAVALEMFLSPLSTVRAASSLDAGTETAERPAAVESERAERPAEGGETPEVGDSAHDGTRSGSAASGRSTVGTQAREEQVEDAAELTEAILIDYMADVSFGVPLNKNGYPLRYGDENDAYFKWESSDSTTWGYRSSGTSGTGYKWMVGDNNYTDWYYVILPDVGRMPDLEFDGFYVLGDAFTSDWWGQPDNQVIKSWSYQDSWTQAVKLEKTTDSVTFTDTDEEADWTAFQNGTAAVYKISKENVEKLEQDGIVRYDNDVNAYRVPIVAKWKDSGRNQITSLKAETRAENGTDTQTLTKLYTEDPAGKADADTQAQVLADINADTFNDGQTTHEFWLRVPEDQASLTLEWEAFEPYYDYNVKNDGAGESPVSVQALFNGQVVTREDGTPLSVQRGWTGEATAAVSPSPSTVNGYIQPRNGYTTVNHVTTYNPARSHWSVADIPLATVDQAKDMSDPYTTVTITVDAPDGSRAAYVIHVERLVTPTSSLGLGNTPMAMIEKDQTGNWGNSEDARRASKDNAKDSFTTSLRLGDPVGPADYTYYKGTYDQNAWIGLTWEGKTNAGSGNSAYYNIDLDETAVVVYQDSAFVDPGVTFVGSDGRKVAFGAQADEVHKNCVTRTIQLRVADTLNAGLYGDANAGEDRWYTVNDAGQVVLSTGKVSTPLQNADGSDGVDLRGLNVLPGVYTIVYSYQDPLDPDAPAVETKRPLVVLPIPGDVNMDGAVTVQDALACQSLTVLDSPKTTDARLLKYRALGDKDATDIMNGFQPTLAHGGRTDYFYPPLPAPENTGYERRTWSEVQAAESTGKGSATLELRYLGLEQGTLQGAELHTTPAADGSTGPWRANAEGKVTLAETNADGSRSYGTYQTDTFWVGVYLKAGDLAGQEIEDLTLSLIYDSNYVTPAVVYGYGDFQDDTSQEERWYSALFAYNFGGYSKLDGAGQTLFSGYTGTDYKFRDGTSWGRSYATHYSKVIGELEDMQRETAESNLKEMVVNFQYNTASATARRATLPADGEEAVCVLVVPFRLIRHPTGSRVNGDSEARLVELGAGMRDFNLVTTAQAGTTLGVNTASVFAQLFSTLSEPQAQTLSAGSVTYAYSAQDSIYGDETHNLREEVAYVADAETGVLSGLIPIGENKSTAARIKDANYAEAYENTVTFGDISGSLPEGLQYTHTATSGTISGTPREAGEFRFTITRTDGVEFYYVLVVNKRELHFKPDSFTSYYGQTEYRGTSAERRDAALNFTFTYDTTELAELDIPDGKTRDDLAGTGEELAAILGADGTYTPPAFTARMNRDDTAAAITDRTDVGDYPICQDAGSGLDDKYILVPDETAEPIVRIRPRPVWVDYLTANAEQTGAEIYSVGSALQQTITLTDDTGTVIHLALDPGEVLDGKYGGLPLTGDAWVAGDEIQLSFSGTFQRNETDKNNFPDSSNVFYMSQHSESRDIGDIAINSDQRQSFNNSNPNYTLYFPISGGTIMTPENNRVLGTVLRQEVVGLAMTSYPAALRGDREWVYGDSITLSDLRIRVIQNNHETDGSYDKVDDDYNSSTAQSMNIHYNWVTKEEMEEGLKDENLNTPVGSGWDPDADPEKGEVEDAMPYDKTNEFLNVGMNGMYLCAIAQTYAGGDSGGSEVSYIKCYSANPLSIVPKVVTLTLTDMERFYGEEGAASVYKYDVNALVSEDLRKLKAELGVTSLTGASEELETLLREDENFVAPTIEYSRIPARLTGEDDPNAVTVDTDATSTTYYQVIFGAAASNYTFQYYRTESKTYSTDFGTALLNIRKRPIVVEDVFSQAGTKEDFAIVYADSKELLLTSQVDDGEKTSFTASAAADAVNRVTFTRPDYEEDTRTLSYYDAGNTNLIRQPGLVYSGEPVLEKDKAELGVQYNVQFIPDDGHRSWNTFSDNFYDVSALEATGGRGQRPVELRDLTLTGSKAGNYVLVYKQSQCAWDRTPDNVEMVTAPRPTTSASTGDALFLKHGTGLVILRPIKDMTFQSVGPMSYTYGEVFAPGNPDAGGKRMVLLVHYDTQYDNYPAQSAGDIYHNISTETVDYTNKNFDERGFTIHYVDSDNAQTPRDVGEDEQVLAGGDPLYPQVHNGKHLFVTGRRGESDALVYSAVTTQALRVDQATLTLTARNVHRYYGEENELGYVVRESYDPVVDDPDDPENAIEPFSYTFTAGQLAQWDREMLETLLGRELRTVDTLTQAQLEDALAAAARGTDDQRAWAAGFGYIQPTITTSATRESPVNNRDNTWGEYPITNTASSFTNYQVTGEGATLYVYPRPIRVTAVRTSAAEPAYTVFSKTDGTIFNTAYEQDRVTVVRSNLLTGASTVSRRLANSALSGALPLTGGALVGTDQLTYQAQVQFYEKIVLPDGETDAVVEVTVFIPQTGLGSASGEVEKNYVLVADFEDPEAVAAVKLRTIGQIIIESVPKAKYTYGESLDLSGLQVQITYMMLGDESQIAERVHVKYIDPNQFQSYGLYVNYWDTRYDTLPDLADDAALKALPNSYRKAATGDHVTIAPTHDTQRFLGNDMSRPLERPFATNGVGLVVSAFQEGENQTASQPKIVAARPELIESAGVSSYELTETNTSPFTFTVSPLRLNYTVSATDKTYNGDTKTAGTLRLTNVFDKERVQTQTYASSDGSVQNSIFSTVTDVVYVPVGADYEGKGDNYTDYTGYGYKVEDGAVAFTTGSYARRSTGYLDKNDVVEWAQGYGWDQDLLEFNFPNANVHYEDETFASGTPGVGTAEQADYWRASQPGNGVDGRWDSYPNVSQMPVEVRNMTFTGPDAANYTWGAGDEPQKYATELTLDSDLTALGAGQGTLPYATIHKANRQPIQDLLAESGFALPELEVDVHTNVVRLTYGEDLSRVPDRIDPADGSDGAVRNETGEESYRDELHFEYALAYQDADGLLRQWAGKDGDQGYQDTRFFGGEVYLPAIDAGYVPELDRLDKVEDADDRTVYRGQRYQWAEEDTGVSDRGWREDAGFYIDPTAYPGYATYGEAVRDAYWYYDLYNTDRTGLPRDTVYYPLVRLAETHNFNPSGDLTADGDGDGQPDISAQALYDARGAVDAYRLDGGTEQAETLKAVAEEKSADVFAAARTMTENARAQAQAQVDRDADIAAGTFPETAPEMPGPAGAVKTYHQRLDLLSASWERNTTGEDGEYLVQIVEDIRFTDTLRYPEQRLMDAVVYNNPKRYYIYAWDPDMSAQIRFGDPDNPVDLDSRMTFAIRRRQPGGDVLDTMWTYEPEGSNHTVQIYVRTSGGGGQTVRTITIVPSILFARVGDRPVQLGLVTDPEMPINRRYTWSSSDPSVATVSSTGLVTIRGEGTAVITVTTTNGKSDSITVVVSQVLPMIPSSNPMFNFYYTDAWADVDGEYAFRPKDTMTRGDVVRLLDVLLNPEYVLSGTREIAYVDVTGKERYYGALVRLTRAGVVEGIPGSAFAGEQLATRAEFVTMLARMLELNVSDTVGMAHAFVDAGEDDTWAYAYIDAAAKAGVVQGTGGGYFAPSRYITREEAAAIIARLVVGRGDIEYKIIPTDVSPENWSYAAVLRAVNSVMTPGL